MPGNYTILDPMILYAADYGAATSRPRLVVIGFDPMCVSTFDHASITAAKAKKRVTVRSYQVAQSPDDRQQRFSVVCRSNYLGCDVENGVAVTLRIRNGY